MNISDSRNSVSTMADCSINQLRKNAQNPPAAVTTAMTQTATRTGGGMSGATLEANITVRSVVSAHTAALILVSLLRPTPCSN